MFHCPVGVWVIEQRAMILSATVRYPTVGNVLVTHSVLVIYIWKRPGCSHCEGDQSPFYEYGLTYIEAWIGNHIHYKAWY